MNPRPGTGTRPTIKLLGGAVLLMVAMLPCTAQAQLSQGGNPWQWGHPLSGQELPATHLSSVDPASAAAMPEDAGVGGYRIGLQRAVEVDLLTEGHWMEVPGGGRICRYAINSPGARMMSVQFSAFHPESGGLLFLYDAGRTTFIGGFSKPNERVDGLFATAFLPGDAIILEYQEPPGATGAEIRISHITHAWKTFMPASDERDFNPGYQSALCHVNVACSEADDWRLQSRASVMFVRPDGNTCNGTLLNNTLQDGTPYVLIANHCYQTNEQQWVFYFNYQSPECIGDTGQTAQTIVGAVKRAGRYGGDFCLMELSQPPPPSFNAYYAGWDRTGNVPQSGVAFANPLSDVKKISVFSNPATSVVEDVTGAPSWQVYWTTGLMQAAGSGASFFDQNKRLVGHMVSGVQTCATATTVPSAAVKFSENWDNGPTSEKRLRDWLDPGNTVMTLDGYDPNPAAPSVQVSVKVLLQGPYDLATGLMTTGLNDAGLLPVTEPYSAAGYVHQGGGGGEVLGSGVTGITGNGRIVDWVVIELRDTVEPGTVLATRAALLRKDGRIVAPDGTGNVVFEGWSPGQYYVAVRHRNHLGIMTFAPLELSAATQLIDLTDGSTPLRGGDEATLDLPGGLAMWAGDATGDGSVKYTGNGNDRDPLLLRIATGNPVDVYQGYVPEDLNMDGAVQYTGSGNDRELILVNMDGNPLKVRSDHLP